MSQQVRITVIDNTASSDRAVRHEMATEGASVGEVVSAVLDGLGDEVSVRYNRTPLDEVPEDTIVREGDRVSISPAKVEGGC